MIRSFKDKETKKIFNRQRSRKLPQDIQQAALRKLRVLKNAKSVQDLHAPPGNRLEKLSGDRKGQHSIRIYDKWRICFRWSKGDANEVETTDYH